MNYSQGKIYKIVDNTTDNIYIGSTCQKYIRKRLSEHVSTYKGYLKGKRRYTSSAEIIKNGNYDIILIEDYPCMRKDQLHKRERYHIENNKCVNKVIPGRTHKESNKNWRDNNKEYVKESNKNWRDNNKEYDKDNKERKLMLERKRYKFKRDCDYLCCIDISIFQ